MDPVKILSQKTILTADLFHVDEVNLEFQGGVLKTFQNVIRRDAVSVIPITDDGQILLVRQYRYILKTEVIEACAGFIEEGEDSMLTAHRELQEETGYTAEKIQLLTNVRPASSVVNWNQFVYFAKGLKKGKTHFDDTEDIKTITISLEDAVAKIFTQEIINGPTIAGIFMLDKMRKEGKI